MESHYSQLDEWSSARRIIKDGLLSIIMPAHNLGNSISDNIIKVLTLFDGKLPFEIIIVDDGSIDNTKTEIKDIANIYGEIRPVYLTKNTGKGAALKSGFEKSRGNYVLLLDADLDLPPHQVSLFFDIMEKENADIVIGSKRHPDSVINYPLHRKLISTVYYALVKLLIGLPIKDTQTGIKLFKREALEWTCPRMLVKRFAFDLELLAIAHEKGFYIVESPITMQFKSTWGCVRPTTIRQVLNDTLAIFYRLRLLRYYQTIRDTYMPEPHPMISIIIAYPAPSDYLAECISAISEQNYDNYEVILLPDITSNTTWINKIREIPTGTIRPAEKRNIGIKNARGTIIAFLDDDSFPAENWLLRAVVYFTDDNIAAVGGPASTPVNDPYMAKLSGKVYANRLVSGRYRYRYKPERVREVNDYPSCNLLVRKNILEQLNGFQTNFWPGEDTYLCMEIVKTLKKKIIYDPRVHVFHHRRKLFLPHLRQISRYALHRGYFARNFPDTSRKLSYMMPTLFVTGLIIGALLAILNPLMMTLYLLALSSYVFITFISCICPKPGSWILTWLGVILTHIVYGVNFAIGLFTKHLPETVQPFDHPSEISVL